MEGIKMLFLLSALLSCLMASVIAFPRPAALGRDAQFFESQIANMYDINEINSPVSGSSPLVLRVARAAAEPKRRKQTQNAKRFGFRG